MVEHFVILRQIINFFALNDNASVIKLQGNELLLLHITTKSTGQSVFIEITVLLSGHILTVFSIPA